MAFHRRTRLALRAAGMVCLVLGLFPYYSHTSDAPPEADVPPITVPGLGTLPDRTASTRLRVGLPFSPLFHYQREDIVTAESTTGPAAGGVVPIKSGDGTVIGEAKFDGEGKFTMLNSKFSYNWRIEFFSWSAALAAIGAVLLVASFWPRGSRPAPPPAPESGKEKGVIHDPENPG
jgi:hypothetical protein